MNRVKLMKFLLQQGFKETTLECKDYYTPEILATFNENQHRYFEKRHIMVENEYASSLSIWDCSYSGIMNLHTQDITRETLAVILLLSEMRGAPQMYIFRKNYIDQIYDKLCSGELMKQYPAKKKRLFMLKERLLQIMNEVVSKADLD